MSRSIAQNLILWYHQIKGRPFANAAKKNTGLQSMQTGVKSRSKPMRIYFAHPMSEYGTLLEKNAIAKISEMFPTDQIVNPNSPDITSAVKTLYPLMGMDLFDSIARNSDMVVAMPFPDGKFGAGVYSEVAAAQRAGKKIMVIYPQDLEIHNLNFFNVEGLSVSETRERIIRSRERRL
jgi:hypothetical protein